jgi:hypothetical protein
MPTYDRARARDVGATSWEIHRPVTPRKRTASPGRRWTASVLLLTLAGCVGTPGGSEGTQPADFLGSYQGSFDSALTADPGDDLNHNPCPADRAPCATHRAPLTDLVLALRPAADDRVTLAFYRSAADLDRGRPVDLLGAGCGTRLAPAPLQPAGPSTVEAAAEATSGAPHSLRYTAAFPLSAENRLCLGKLRPTSTHRLVLELHEQPQSGERFARVVVDKAVRDENYLYVVEDGKRRRVRIAVDDTLEGDPRPRYRVCIEDELGEYGRCVLTDREFRSIALPLPWPGGAAVNVTWWQTLEPALRRTRGLFAVEQYVGHFAALEEDFPAAAR